MSRDLCLLSTTRFLGGGEAFQIKLSKLLYGHMRLVVVSPRLPSLRDGLCQTGADFVELSARGGLALRWRFLKWLWRQRDNIRARGTPVVLNGRGAAYLAPLVRALTGKPPFIIAHTELSMRAHDIKEMLYGVAAHFAGCIITVSDSVAAQHERRWPKLRVESIPNWVDFGSGVVWGAVQPSPAGVMFNAAIVARLAPQKGVEDVVAGCAEEGGIELHVYGDGPMRDQLCEAGREFAWLHFHGHVDDLPRRLPTHSVLISGSYSESFSFSVAEGIQAGLLCVVSDIPAHRELLGESYPDELFFPPGDRTALKRALAAARAQLSSSDGEGARAVVAAAMSRLRERNSPELARQRYLAVLCRECGEGRAA